MDTELEMLLCTLFTEIEEVKNRTVKANLYSIANRLYRWGEENAPDETAMQEHHMMREILRDRLPWEDKVYFKVKYGLDFEV